MSLPNHPILSPRIQKWSFCALIKAATSVEEDRTPRGSDLVVPHSLMYARHRCLVHHESPSWYESYWLRRCRGTPGSCCSLPPSSYISRCIPEAATHCSIALAKWQASNRKPWPLFRSFFSSSSFLSAIALPLLTQAMMAATRFCPLPL